MGTAAVTWKAPWRCELPGGSACAGRGQYARACTAAGGLRASLLRLALRSGASDVTGCVKPIYVPTSGLVNRR